MKKLMSCFYGWSAMLIPSSKNLSFFTKSDKCSRDSPSYSTVEQLSHSYPTIIVNAGVKELIYLHLKYMYYSARNDSLHLDTNSLLNFIVRADHYMQNSGTEVAKFRQSKWLCKINFPSSLSS